MTKAKEAVERRAEKALLTSMREKAHRLVPGTLEVIGQDVSWTESCRTKESRSGAGACHHARYSLASGEALDDYFAAVGL